MKKIGVFFKWLLTRIVVVLCVLVVIFGFFAIKNDLNERATPLAEQLMIVQMEYPDLHLQGCSLDETILRLEQAGEQYSHWNPLNWVSWSEHHKLAGDADLLASLQEPWYVKAWGQTLLVLWWVVVLVVFILLCVFGKYLWRTVLFWCLSPFLSRRSAMRLVKKGIESSVLVTSEEAKQLVLPIASNSMVFVKNNYVKVYDRESLKKRTRWLAWWRFPFTSYGAKLRRLTCFQSTGKGDSEVSITDDNPDVWLSLIRLENHSGMMVYPRCIVALVNVAGLKVRSHWKLFSLQAWCMGQLRFFTISGTGGVVIKAMGGLQAVDVSGKRQGFEEDSLLAYDANLGLKSIRTETFIPYFLGDEDLLDVTFESSEVEGAKAARYVYTKNSLKAEGEMPVSRGWFDSLLSYCCKLLGM